MKGAIDIEKFLDKLTDKLEYVFEVDSSTADSRLDSSDEGEEVHILVSIREDWFVEDDVYRSLYIPWIKDIDYRDFTEDIIYEAGVYTEPAVKINDNRIQFTVRGLSLGEVKEKLCKLENSQFQVNKSPENSH